MPIFVTDGDVLAQIGLNEAEAQTISAQVASMGATVPPATLAAWTADLASWHAWATAATARLSGGFIFGEWNGVPADGDAAMAWKAKLDGYQTILSAVQKGVAPPYTVPPSSSVAGVSDANNAAIVNGATGALASASDSVSGPLKWLALAAVAVAAVAVLRK